MKPKNFFIKKLSFVLAFVLIFTSFKVDIAKSAVDILEYNLNQSLKEGTVNTIPSVDGRNPMPDQVLFSWDFHKINGSNVSNSEYEFSYFVEDNKKAVFKVTKINNRAEVTYQLFAVDENNNESLVLLPETYSIHTNINSGGGKNYVDYKYFLSLYEESVDLNYMADDKEYPSFIIKQNSGFSFRYDSRTVQFLWQDNKFYLSSSHISQGTIYDIDFKYKRVGSATVYNDKLNILTGISKETFSSIPLANKNQKNNNLFNTVKNGILDIDEDLKTLFDTTPLEIIGNDATDDEPPGSDVAGLCLRFDMPKYLGAGNKYEYLPQGSGIYKIPLLIDLNNEKDNNKLTVKIDDITKANLGVSDVSIFNGTVVDAKRLDNSSRIHLLIEDLPAGAIYNDSVVTILGNDTINKSDIKLEFPKVFTFPKYEIVFENGKFYVQIQPYQGYDGYYLLKTGHGENSLDSSVTQYSDGKKPLLLPIDVGLNNPVPKYYQVFFDPVKPFDESNLKDAVYSQILKFIPDKKNITIGIPNNFKVNSYKLIPDSNVANNEKANLEMNVSWDIGEVSLIDLMLENNNPLEIIYDFQKSLTPSPKDEKLATKVKLSIKKENDGKVYVTYSGDGVISKTVLLESKIDPETERSIYQSNLDLSLESIYKYSKNQVPKDTDFLYPNIYFLNVKPTNVNGKDVYVGASLYDSITLNDITKSEVSPPQNLEITDITTTSKKAGDARDEVSFKLKYILPSTNIKEYIENNFKQPLAPNDSVDVKVNLYITHNENYLKGDFSKYSYEERKSNSVEVPYKDIYDKVLYFSEIEGNKAMEIAGYEDPRSALRDNKTVRIDGIKLTPEEVKAILSDGVEILKDFKFDGMDKNQKYYLIADLEVIYKHGSTGTLASKPSSVSNIVGLLTKGDKEEIDEKEKVPPAPILNKKDITNDRATIFWDKINSLDSEGKPETIEYEIIRLKDSQLENNLLESKIPFEKFFANNMPDVEKLGFKTDKTNLLQYLNGSFNNTGIDEFEYKEGVDSIELIDKTLFPNQLYFYYVRTVRIVDGQKIYSVWSNVSVTTNPVKHPINLQIVRDKLKYDPKTEFVIEFDAPIADINKLGTEYFLEYSLKEDDNAFEKPVQMDISELKENYSKSLEEGYIHFIYKIRNLKHGTNYVIRVRLVDYKGDASLYSNTATTRTNLDQEDYENEKETTDWLDFIKQELDKILKNPYWTAADNNSLFEAIFRENMFDGYLAQFPDSIVNLPVGISGDKTYYFPISSIKKLNDSKKGLKVAHGDMEVIISSGSLNENSNEAIKIALEKIKNYELADMYIRLNVNFKNRDEKIEGQEILGSIAEVYFEVVGSTEVNLKFDESVYNILLNEVKDQTSKETLKNRINRLIKRNAPKEEIHKEINSFIEDVKYDFYKAISKEFKDAVKGNYIITKLDSSIIIVQKNQEELSGIKGYKKMKNEWHTVDVSSYNGHKGIYTNEPGLYAFTGYNIYIIGLDGMENSDEYKKLIIKYSLLDFFGKDAFTVDDPATKNMVTGSLGRMIGAQKGEDSIKYLASKGIKTNNRKMYSPINIQDTLYLSMGVYEVKTKTKLSAIKIRDYNTINKISGIDTKNKLSIQTAFETGIYKNKNMNPNANLKINELLQILKALDM